MYLLQGIGAYFMGCLLAWLLIFIGGLIFGADNP